MNLASLNPVLLLLCYGTAWLASACLLEMKKNAVHVEDFRRKQMGVLRALLPLPALPVTAGLARFRLEPELCTVTSVTCRPRGQQGWARIWGVESYCPIQSFSL